MILDSFKTYLQQFPHYTEKAYEQVLPFLKERKIEAEDFFLRDGKICRSIAFVKEGMLRLYYLNDGKEVTTCFCKSNTITCSYKSLITQQPSDVSIQAIEDCILLEFSYSDLQQLYAKDPFWQQVGRLAAENEFITTDCHVRFLSDLSATERYMQVLHNDPELLQRVPLAVLASYLQVSPETLSRIRKKISNLT